MSGCDLKLVPNERRKLLFENHDNSKSGHNEIYKAFQRIFVNYYWPELKIDESKYVRKYKICLANKREYKSHDGLICGRPLVPYLWGLVSMDIVSLRSVLTYILCLQDYFSNCCIFLTMRAAVSKTICFLIEENVLFWSTGN